MGAYLYRLYAIQSFKGEEIAVYVQVGNCPDGKILSDAMDISDGEYPRAEVMANDEWLYGMNEVFPNHGPTKRKELATYTRLIKRSKDVIAKNNNVEKAIFVNSTNKRDWRGENTLYANSNLECFKIANPEYSACKPIGNIHI